MLTLDILVLLQITSGGLLLGAVYALAALGLNLIFGVMRVVNLAHGDLIMLGAYGGFWAFTLAGWNPVAALLVTIPALFLLGCGLQRLLVHRVVGHPPLMSLLLLWGVSLIIINAALFLWTSNVRSVPAFTGGIDLGGISVSRARGIAFLGSVGLGVGFWLVLQRTRWGKAIRATAQSGELAQVCGIDVAQVRVLTFGVAAAMAGAAGTFLVAILALSPVAGPSFLLKSFAIVVIGGLGSPAGALLGALVVGVLESFAAYAISAQAADAVVYLALIAFLLLRPGGLLGSPE